MGRTSREYFPSAIALMAAQEYRNVIERRELVGVVVFAIVGIALVALARAKQPVERDSAVVA